MADRVRQIVLTGVSRGLGRALADAMIEKGHVIFGCARSRESIQDLRSRWPSPHDFAVVDVAAQAQVRRWAARILPRMPSGAPDLLINNAAVINANATLWQVPAREFSDVVDINIKGCVNVIRYFLPAMIRRGHGVIVNLSSGWGRGTSAEVAPYCATKWAIEGLTAALAQELPPGLAAVPLNPGVIDTDMLRSCFGKSAASYPTPEDWAKVAVPFLLSLGPESNGKPLTVPKCRKKKG